MQITRLLFKLINIIGLTLTAVFSAQAATCPDVQGIINAFDKNGLPPKGWLLGSYTGTEIDRNFIFKKAEWNSNGSKIKLDGNIKCQYSSEINSNPGYLIIETTQTVPEPTSKNWQPTNNEIRTTVCKQSGKIENCDF